MSDFGLDAYALDDPDTAGQPHPLEIARDLIAGGKPRAALDVLGDHHEQLVDDPEYLLLCSAAWWADGDTIRAQQALQGAARLAPDDPRPLQGLGELLAARGEHDKSELILAKARALEAQAIESQEPFEELGLEGEEDLIAFAERRERKAHGALTTRQLVLGLISLLGFVVLIAGIVFVTSPREEAAPSGDVSSPSQDATGAIEPPPAVEAATSAATEGLEAAAPVDTVNTAEAAVAVEMPRPSETIAPPKSATAHRKSVSPPGGSVRPRKPSPAPPSRKPESPQPVGAPSDSVVEAELGSMNSSQLTTRADELYARGHSGLATSYYRRALELDPDYAPALVGMGRSILRAKKYSDAMKNATRALELARGVDARPGLEAAAIYQIGRVHYERGEQDSARRLFRQSISLPGAPPEAWFYLGEALSRDNSPAARQAYEKYLERVPTGHLADRAHRAIQ